MMFVPVGVFDGSVKHEDDFFLAVGIARSSVHALTLLTKVSVGGMA